MLRPRVLLAALALAGQGCGGPPPEAGAGTSAPPAAAAPLELVDLAGLDRALAAHRGRPVLLNFWAMWCPPCVAELPELVAAAAPHRERLDLVAVSFDLLIPDADRATIQEKVRAFLAQRDLALPTLVYDAPDYDAINARFDLPGAIPVTLALDANGAIVERQRGQASRARFDELIQKALGSGAPAPR